MRHSCFEPGRAELRQRDNADPTTALQVMPSEQYGVFLAETHFRGSALYRGSTPFHLLVFQLGQGNSFRCRVDGKGFEHWKARGDFTLCPAGIEAEALADGDFSSLIVGVAQDCLAMLSDSSLQVSHREGSDPSLFRLALGLRDQARRSLPGGLLAWSDSVSELVAHLATRYACEPAVASGRHLPPRAIRRLRELVLDDPAAPMDVETLARATKCSQFHFARRFRQTVGMTPYRWVMRLRLSCAVALIAHGQDSLADIAAASGFADQSHLCRWVRTVYGVPPSALRATTSPRAPGGRVASSP